MNKNSIRRKTCRCCGSFDIEVVMKLAATPPGDSYVPGDRVHEVQESYPLDLALCHNCGLVQILDDIDPKLLYTDYIYNTSISLGLDEHFKKYSENILNFVKPDKGKLVIDIGSNDGTLLRSFKSNGLKVLGIDPAKEIAEKVTETGIETLPEFFTLSLAKKIKEKYGHAGIITANNVMANVVDLTDFVKGVRELLDDDGVFVFETGYLMDIVQKMLIDTIHHEHLCYFSVKPLDAFFRNLGMELINVERILTKGGSLRGYVQLANGNRKASSSVKEIIGLESREGMDKIETFKELAAKINKEKDRLLRFLENVKEKGGNIIGYGASIGSTTLIYTLGLSGFLDLLVDDNPVRYGLYSPGDHIPVRPSEEIYNKNPDYVVVLAWRYFEQILKKHKAYLDKGGKFLVPLPNFKLYES